MADINCVVCNRMNDARAERCWYCGAVLPAAIPGLHHPEDEVQPDSHEDEPEKTGEELVPEWLKRIRERERVIKNHKTGVSEQVEELDETGENSPEPVEEPGGEEETETSDLLTVEDPIPAAEPQPVVDVQTPNELVEPAPVDLPIAAEDSIQAEHEPDLEMQEVQVEDITPPERQLVEEEPSPEEINPVIDEFGSPFIDGDFPAWHSFGKLPVKNKNTGDAQVEQLENNLQTGEKTSEPGQDEGSNISDSLLSAGKTDGLLVNMRQRENAELFRQLMEEPQLKKADEPNRHPGRMGLSKLLIACLLFIAVLVPFLFSGAPGVAPKLYANEVVAAYQIIQQLPQDKPVLVAADFEAATAGEMNWISKYVLKPFVSRNLPIAIMSTNILGSAVIEDDIFRMLGQGEKLVSSTQVVNLGYLPGGTIGLMSLASDWGGALPYTTDLQISRDVPLLKGINTISDFSAVVVFTDSAENARSWVEQVSPSLGSTPLLVVISAQAAPMVQPYYDSGQVDGMIPGIYGALVFDGLAQKTASPGSVFASYQLTLLVLAILILVGGLGYFIVNSISPEKA